MPDSFKDLDSEELHENDEASPATRKPARVKQGGHNVPRADVLRRYVRGWKNFETAYKPLADAWRVYDNSGGKPELMESKL